MTESAQRSSLDLSKHLLGLFMVTVTFVSLALGSLSLLFVVPRPRGDDWGLGSLFQSISIVAAGACTSLFVTILLGVLHWTGKLPRWLGLLVTGLAVAFSAIVYWLRDG